MPLAGLTGTNTICSNYFDVPSGQANLSIGVNNITNSVKIGKTGCTV